MLGVVDINGNLDVSSDGVTFIRVINGGAKDVAVASSGEIWYVGTDGYLYRMNATGGWDQVVGPNIAFASASINGPSVAYVDGNFNIYIKQGYDSINNFAQVTVASASPQSFPVRVAVGGPKILYYIDTNNRVFQTDPTTGTTTQPGTISQEVSVASDGTAALCLIGSLTPDPTNGIYPYLVYRKNYNDPTFRTPQDQVTGQYCTHIALQSVTSGYIITTPTASPPGVVKPISIPIVAYP